MKKKALLTLALLGAGAYYLYQNKDELKRGFEVAKQEAIDTKQTINATQQSLSNIKHNVNYLLSQKENLTALGQDLTYQVKTFNSDTQARLTEIQSVMAKYQEENLN